MTTSPSSLPTDAELQYYYLDFYRVLKRYRFMTVLGWIIVCIGAVGVPFGWEFGRWHGFLDLILSGCTILAGLATVQQSVTALDAYVNVPFPPNLQGSGGEDEPAPVAEARQLMQEINGGGWQDAYAGIQRLRDLGAKYDLPSLE